MNLFPTLITFYFAKTAAWKLKQTCSYFILICCILSTLKGASNQQGSRTTGATAGSTKCNTRSLLHQSKRSEFLLDNLDTSKPTSTANSRTSVVSKKRNTEVIPITSSSLLSGFDERPSRLSKEDSRTDRRSRMSKSLPMKSAVTEINRGGRNGDAMTTAAVQKDISASTSGITNFLLFSYEIMKWWNNEIMK